MKTAMLRDARKTVAAEFVQKLTALPPFRHNKTEFKVSREQAERDIKIVTQEMETQIDNFFAAKVNAHIFSMTYRSTGVVAGLTKAGEAAKELLRNPKVRAFLDMISFAEGNTDYRTGFNFQRIEDLSKHPGTAKGGSTAAGRYQFRISDWNDVKDKLGLPDFTAESQDIAATYLLQTRPLPNKNIVIIDALLSDNFNEAVQRAAFVWASLPYDFGDGKTNPDTNPRSYHTFKGKPQPVKSRRELWTAYNAALGSK